MLVVAKFAIVAVLVLMAVIGFLHMTRGTAVRRVRGVGADGTPLAPSEPEFALGVAVVTGAALLSGNSAEIALNGDGTYPRLWDDLRSAQRVITIQMYYGAPGTVADTMRSILTERARAGVRVYLLYDAFGNQDVPDDHFESLRAAGVNVHPFRPFRLADLHLLQHRSHVRGIIIDNRIAWTGGFGIDDKWLGDGRTNGAWRDTNVRFEGPAVRQLQSVFAAGWTEATGVLLTGRATLETTDDDLTAGVLFGAPTLGSTSAARYLAMSISGATSRLYITNAYFAPDDNFIGLLRDAAARGVDVRLLVAGPRTDVRTTRYAGRSRYETLLEAGVRIWEWQPSTIHAKTFVADGRWSSIGTMNFDNRSLALNNEVVLMVLDDAFGARMEAVYVADLEHATEIELASFRRRPWTQRVLEGGARLLTRVL